MTGAELRGDAQVEQQSGGDARTRGDAGQSRLSNDHGVLTPSRRTCGRRSRGGKAGPGRPAPTLGGHGWDARARS